MTSGTKFMFWFQRVGPCYQNRKDSSRVETWVGKDVTASQAVGSEMIYTLACC